MAKPTRHQQWLVWVATILLGSSICALPAIAKAGNETPTGHMLDGQDGITLSGSYIGEFERNYDPGLVSSSLKTGYHDKLILSLSADTGQAGLWPGGTLFIQGIRIHGDEPSRSVIGDLQVVSNIEAPEQTLIEEAWYEQKLMKGKLSLLAGLYDLNRDFYVSDDASIFLNSSFGIGPDISANVPASIYPRPSWGARIRIQPTTQWYVQLADFDDDPQTRALSAREGQMWITETGLVHSTGDFKLGAWLHTLSKAYDGRVYRNDYGTYVLAEQRLVSIGVTKIDAFMRYGWTPPARNEVTQFVGMGLHVMGPLPARVQDELGLGLVRAIMHNDAEDTIELTYLAQMTAWLSVQPSFQWIMHPGGAPNARAIRVGLMRFKLDF